MRRSRRARCRARARARAGALAAGLLSLASCQTYEARPLDAAAHRDAWHARVPEASLGAFLDDLDAAADGDPGAFDPTDGLSLREGQLVAFVFNPALRLARLRAERAAAGSAYAGLMEDPRLSLSVLRITESVPDHWVITPALTFSFPLSDRREAARDLAGAEQRAEALGVREAEWSVRHETARAWIEWSAWRLRVDETSRLAAAMGDLVRTTSQLAEHGELQRPEAALFLVEEARRANQLAWLRGEALVAEQRVRAVLGLAPEAPVELLPALVLGPERVGTGAGPDTIAARHPGLARLRAEYEVAEQALRHEVEQQYPDLTLGPQYEEDEGQSRIGVLGGIPLPVLDANRRGIAEARVEREIARAAVETAYEALVGRWAGAVARVEALAAQRAHMQDVLVPLVERQLEDAVALVTLGEGSSLLLLESLTRAHQTRLDLIDVRSSEALARAELESLIGPETAPSTTDAPEHDP